MDAGHNARPVTDAAGVLAESHVAHVMASVFDALMASDGSRGGQGVERDLASVEADLLARGPQPGARVLQVGQAGDTHDTGHVRDPVGVELVDDVEHLDPPVLLAAMAAAIGGFKNVPGGLTAAQLTQRIPQTGLVALHPDQQGVTAGRGLGKGVFWQ